MRAGIPPYQARTSAPVVNIAGATKKSSSAICPPQLASMLQTYPIAFLNRKSSFSGLNRAISVSFPLLSAFFALFPCFCLPLGDNTRGQFAL